MSDLKERIPYNLNDEIGVKLTERGLRLHYEMWEAFETFKVGKGGEPTGYQPPATDENGFSRWIMWEFMETYGPFIGMGRTPPCYMQIVIFRKFPTTSSPLVGPSKGTV